MKIAFTYKKQNLFSKIVSRLTKSKWSHTFLVLDRGSINSDDYLIIESAFFGGVKFNLLSKYTKNPKVIIEIIDVPELDDNIDEISQYIGESYGYLQSLGFLWMKLFNKIRNPRSSGLWCSELVWLKLMSSSLKNVFVTHLRDSVTPEDIYKELKKL